MAQEGRGVVLSGGSTNVVPVPPRDNLLRALRLHFQDVRHSLVGGFYHGWDLHPAQLVTRYAAVYDFFREALEPAAQFANVQEDPAAGRVRASLARRALDCGAMTPDEARAAGLT